MRKCKYKWQEKQFPITKLTEHARTDHTAQVRNLVFIYVRKKKKKKKKETGKSLSVFSYFLLKCENNIVFMSWVYPFYLDFLLFRESSFMHYFESLNI